MATTEKTVEKSAKLSVQTCVRACFPETREVNGNPFKGCDSASLRLTKLLQIGNFEKVNFCKRDKGGRVIEEKTIANEPSKGAELSAIVATYDRGRSLRPTTFLPPYATTFYAKLEGNLAINLSGGVLENAFIAMHRHFNAVQIPGSAVKGVARHAAWLKWSEAVQQGDTTTANRVAAQIYRIFGYPTNNEALDAVLKKQFDDRKTSGCIAFFAAYPEDNAPLVQDIVTCHHPKYYQGKRMEATDDELPIPAPFLSLKKGCLFAFSLAPLRGASNEDFALAKAFLIEAITVQGVGAKTASGYGWFSFDEAESNQKLKELEQKDAKARAEKAKREQAEKAELERIARAEKDRNTAARREQMTPEEFVKDWMLTDWTNSKLSPTMFEARPESEQLLAVKLFRTDDVCREIWEEIKKNTEQPSKKKIIEKFRPLEQKMRKLAKDHKSEIGGKLP